MAQAMVRRQRELGLAQREVAFRSGVSVATLRKMQSGAPATFRPQTLARVSEALEWPSNALLLVLEGGRPPPARRTTTTAGREARLAAMCARLAAHEFRAVERLVEELLKGSRATEATDPSRTG
ncbi:MAG: helix-turn-helix transcriptional regulator [Actinobacteria bacterium]|nr:helix-turn-helix transcriptional regulator [Actinomycetota bacterium]